MDLSGNLSLAWAGDTTTAATVRRIAPGLMARATVERALRGAKP